MSEFSSSILGASKINLPPSTSFSASQASDTFIFKIEAHITAYYETELFRYVKCLSAKDDKNTT